MTTGTLSGPAGGPGSPQAIVQPLTREQLGAAVRTAWCSFVSSVASSSLMRLAGVLVVALEAGLWVMGGWPLAVPVAVGLLVWAVIVMPIGLWISFAIAVNADPSQPGSRVVWTNPAASIVLVAKRKTRGGKPCYPVSGFAAWPRGNDATGAFRRQLYKITDAEGAVVTATAINNTLFKENVYTGRLHPVRRAPVATAENGPSTTPTRSRGALTYEGKVADGKPG